MDNLYWLDEIKLSDAQRLRTLVGDKAFYLSQLQGGGYRCVPGFVVSSLVLKEFLASLNPKEPLFLDLPDSGVHLDVDNYRSLQQVAQRLRQKITSAVLPSEFLETLSSAVERLSAPNLIFRPTLSLPAWHKSVQPVGLLSPHYNCNLTISADRSSVVALTLKQTWSEMFRAKSLLYWQKMGVKLHEINLAVLVQPLWNAIASGTLKYNPTQLEIQATCGLALNRGESVDVYIIDPETGIERSRDLGNKLIAYGLANSDNLQLHTPQLAPENCPEAYLLGDAQQQYALDDTYLQQLIQLAQKLKTDFNWAFSLEWTLQKHESEPPQLWITQFCHSSLTPRKGVEETSLPAPTEKYARNRPRSSYLQDLPPPQHLIRGIGAATGQAKAIAYVIDDRQKPPHFSEKIILVAQALVSAEALALVKHAAAVITEQGGLTSHSAILAREFGIPAVVNAGGATTIIQTGELLLVDGDKGEIYRVTEEDAQMPSQTGEKMGVLSLTTAQLPAIATQLMVNLSQTELLEQVQEMPIDGVGLLRSELMALAVLEGQHPDAWLQQGRKDQLIDLWQAQIGKFARAFAPRPIFYRSLDWRSYGDFDARHNAFSYQLNPAFLNVELTAIAALEQSGCTNIRLLLPFVRTVEEFSRCRQQVEQHSFASLQLWIMAEVPSILFLLPEYVKAGVQGVAIGTNDLTQLLLGIDREGEVKAGIDQRHPAVISAIAQIIKMATQAGIPCSICGQAPALYPEIIDMLVRSGITIISVEPEAVEKTYRAIARAEHRLILEASRRQLSQN